jgi:Ca2+-binding RTX toxin-like protein
VEPPPPPPPPPPPSGQSPFPGPGAPLLAASGSLVIDASNYDSGGLNVAYFDTTPGIVNSSSASDGGRTGSDVDQTTRGDIGWVVNGEWLEYTISVAEAGLYDLSVLMGTINNARSTTFSFTLDGAASAYVSSGPIATANTGSYATFQANTAADIALQAGLQTVRVTFSGSGQDFRSFSLTAQSGDVANFAATLTSSTLSQTLDASGPSATSVIGPQFGDQLIVDPGSNRLDGQGDNDRLVGSAGDDLLTGGAARDSFVFAPNFGNDRITDFRGGPGVDLIILDGLGLGRSSEFSESTTDTSEGALLDLGSNGSILFEGVAEADLVADNFVFLA